MTHPALRLGVVLAWAASACSGAPDAPTAPPATDPTYSLAVSGQFRFAGTTLGARLSVSDRNPGFAWWGAHTVTWESSNPAVAVVSPGPGPTEADVRLLGSGTAAISARVDGVRSTVVSLQVEPFPPPTQALVVESFTLYDFVDPFEPPGRVSYMPMIRLREPSGTASASVVGIMAAMPSAPPTGWCEPSPARTWAPGASAELLGLDRYSHEPEFWFGPYQPSPTIGPVEVTLIVRDGTGALGSITLSKTMGAADITTVAPRVMAESRLGCG